MKKNILILFFAIFLIPTMGTGAMESDTLVSSVIQYKQSVMQEKRQRVTIYNALNLTQEQIEKKESLLTDNDCLLQEKFDDLFNQTYRMNTLKDSNATESEITAQKKVINCIKKDIKTITQKEDKQFKKILTRDQRAKYSMIKHLERLDEKRENKDYYKSNPGLVPFGNI